MFLYTVKAEDFSKLPYGVVTEKIAETIPEGHLLKDIDFAIKELDMGKYDETKNLQSAKEWTIQNSLSTNEVITFASSWQPEDIEYRLRHGTMPHVWLALSPDEQMRLQQLHDFRLEISYKSPLNLDNNERTLEYSGLSAVHALNDELRREERQVRDAIESRYSLREKQTNIAFYNNDELLFQATYESGKQELFESVNKQGGIIPEKLQESVSLACKYLPCDMQPTKLSVSEHSILNNLPAIEESRENYIKTFHASFDPKDSYRAADYYYNVTLLNPNINSTEDFSRRIVTEMIKDGITQNRMQKIVEHLPIKGEIKQAIGTIIQSAETKSAIRKVKNAANKNIENEEFEETR